MQSPSAEPPPMNIGIIGSGFIARVHALAIRDLEGCTLHSVHNHRPEGAEKLAAEFGIRAHHDLAAFLADPALDVVSVCTPSGAHFAPAMAALEAGKHVIVEKPLEVTSAKIDELAAAASSRGLKLASILNRRFTPAIDALKSAVGQGRFGRLTSASCYVKWFRDQAYYDSAAWRGTLALDGGGALMNQAIHAIDALIHLAGPVASVQALTGCLAHERIEVEDIGVAAVEFESGALGVIEGSTCCWSASGHPVRIQLCGTAGSVFLADETFEVWDFREALPVDADIREKLMNRQTAGLGANNPAAIGHLQHLRNFQDFIAAIRDDREPATSASQARQAVAVIEAIYQSAASNGARIRPAAPPSAKP